MRRVGTLIAVDVVLLQAGDGRFGAVDRRARDVAGQGLAQHSEIPVDPAGVRRLARTRIGLRSSPTLRFVAVIMTPTTDWLANSLRARPTV